MKIREIMSEDVACCTPETGLVDAAQMMQECDCGAIPVVQSEQGHQLSGIITDRDIIVRAVAKGRDPRDMTVSDCMSTSVESISEDAGLDECIRLMERLQVRRVPVVDQDGNCVGIVSQADIALKASEHEVAEILREISEPTEMHATHSH